MLERGSHAKESLPNAQDFSGNSFAGEDRSSCGFFSFWSFLAKEAKIWRRGKNAQTKNASERRVRTSRPAQGTQSAAAWLGEQAGAWLEVESGGIPEGNHVRILSVFGFGVRVWAIFKGFLPRKQDCFSSVYPPSMAPKRRQTQGGVNLLPAGRWVSLLVKHFRRLLKNDWRSPGVSRSRDRRWSNAKPCAKLFDPATGLGEGGKGRVLVEVFFSCWWGLWFMKGGWFVKGLNASGLFKSFLVWIVQ